MVTLKVFLATPTPKSYRLLARQVEGNIPKPFTISTFLLEHSLTDKRYGWNDQAAMWWWWPM